MITKEIIENTNSQGMPALKELFEKLPKEEALKGIGIMVILGLSALVINTIKEIVMKK